MFFVFLLMIKLLNRNEIVFRVKFVKCVERVFYLEIFVDNYFFERS